VFELEVRNAGEVESVARDERGLHRRGGGTDGDVSGAAARRAKPSEDLSRNEGQVLGQGNDALLEEE
jgi:hypothetical protein